MKIFKIISWTVFFASVVALFIITSGYKCDHLYASPATCTENGLCPVCEKTWEASGHENKLTSIAVATCTSHGYNEFTCSVCGNVEKKTIYAKGHKVDNWKQKKASTEKSEGLKQGKCSVCNETVQKTIPQLGSSYLYPITVASIKDFYYKVMKNKSFYKNKYFHIKAKVLKRQNFYPYRGYLVYGTWNKGAVCHILSNNYDYSIGDNVQLVGYLQFSGNIANLRSCYPPD